MKQGIVTYTKLTEDAAGIHGYGFLEDTEGASYYFSSSAIFQNAGLVDNLSRGDEVTF